MGRMTTARLEHRLAEIPLRQAGIALAAAAAVGLSLGASPDLRVAFGVLAFGGVAALGFVKPAVLLLAFLAARPVLDAWSDQRFIDGVPSANPAGATALLVIALLVVAVAARPALPLPRATGAFALVIALSVVAAGWGIYDLRGAIGLAPATELVRLAI